MVSKHEILALAFGALLMLVTFGDDYISSSTGNLDTIFGLQFWRSLDVFFIVATIAVFLLYGYAKGNGLKFNYRATLIFVSFVAVLMLITVDDLLQVLSIDFDLPQTYWIIIMWVYPIYSSIAFIFFGQALDPTNIEQKTGPM
jgi:hypothetical protein